MNLILWLLSGGLVGGFSAWLFASTSSYGLTDLVVSLVGALLGGLLSSMWMPATPVGNLDEYSFSPGSLIMATTSSILFLVLINSLTAIR